MLILTRMRVLQFSYLFIFALIMTPFTLAQNTLTVPNPYTTIQSAIDAAVPGDTILVAPGQYFENIDFGGLTNVTVRSDSNGQPAAATTIIDGNIPIGRKSVVTFSNGEDRTTVLDSFTIQNGIGTTVNNPAPRSLCGGGILIKNSEPTIQNCIIKHNVLNNNTDPVYGAGICVIRTERYLAGPKIENCTIRENSAGLIVGATNVPGSKGGGIACRFGKTVISNCTISENTALGFRGFGPSYPQIFNSTFDTAGGGLFIENRYGNGMQNGPLITGCIVNDNTTSGWGAGVYLESSIAAFTDCAVNNNMILEDTQPIFNGESGGGFFCAGHKPNWTDAATFDNCIISTNKAIVHGGGVFLFDCNPTFKNGCLISSNIANYINDTYEYGFGGGLYCDMSHFTMTDCSIESNKANFGGGAYIDTYVYEDSSEPRIHRCDFFNNTSKSPGHGGAIYCENSSPVITSSYIRYNNAQGDSECSKGGGIFCTSSLLHENITTLINCMIIWNNGYIDEKTVNGSGIYCDENSGVNVYSCTLSDNYSDWVTDGESIYCDGLDSSATVINSIIWNNYSTSLIPIYGTVPSNISVTSSDIQNASNFPQPSWFDSTCIDADPLFYFPPNYTNGYIFPFDIYNYHLGLVRNGSDSPCIDTGDKDLANNTPIYEDFLQNDIDCINSVNGVVGDARIITGPLGTQIDMGADEAVYISAASPDPVTFKLVTDRLYADTVYLLLGSIKGTALTIADGIAIPGGQVLPIQWDAFTDFIIAQLNTSKFINFQGTIDQHGMAINPAATTTGPPVMTLDPLPGKHIGKVLHFAFACEYYDDETPPNPLWPASNVVKLVKILP